MAEALLGDSDAKKLGTITNHKDEGEVKVVNLQVVYIKWSGCTVNTGKDARVQPSQQEHDLTISVGDILLGYSVSDKFVLVKVKSIR